MKKVEMILILVSLLAIAFSQTERWVYWYNGLGNDWDRANSLGYGADGNIYIAGSAYNIGTYDDFTVISLTSNGYERWVYQHNGPGNIWDGAYSLVYGTDGNIYAAGYSIGSGTSYDFLVISLTSTGTERWVYRYNGPGNYDDWANSLVYGIDGNIYVAGMSHGSIFDADFTVISLTSTGTERWVYRYTGPGDYYDWGKSLIYGSDGNIYAAGGSEGDTSSYDFLVISLTSTGTERWVYRYNGPGNYNDWANSLVYGTDENIYAAGMSFDSLTYGDFIVISLTSIGVERWVYRYNGPGNLSDMANSIIYGADGNIYAAGDIISSSTCNDFTVISLITTGTERWVYRYHGSGYYWNEANSLVFGTDGNIYAAGLSTDSITYRDFTVISLTSTGSERWVYYYDGPGNDYDIAYSLIYGADGNIYAAGMSFDNNTQEDFTVISLNPTAGNEEEKSANFCPQTAFRISLGTFQKQNLAYSISIHEPSTVSLSLYNLSGQKIVSWQISASKGISHYVKNLPNLSIGVYVIRAEVLGKGYKENKKFIVVK